MCCFLRNILESLGTACVVIYKIQIGIQEFQNINIKLTSINLWACFSRTVAPPHSWPEVGTAAMWGILTLYYKPCPLNCRLQHNSLQYMHSLSADVVSGLH